MQYPQERLQKLYSAYVNSFDLLTLSREEYVRELDEITTDIVDYKYCLRPSYSWPFIMYNGVRYLPLPHLLIKSVTVSLMHRLTLADNDLRERIGKYVLEPYLFKLISSSDEFDEVVPEQVYWLGKKEQRTLDVMTRVGSDILCFDSKSLTPRIDIRIFSEEAYEKTKQKEVKAITQAYLHIHDKFGSEYCYLSVPVEADRSNIFALIIVSENPYAHIVLKPTDGVRENDVLKQLLCRNPSANGEVIRIFFVKRLCGFLDDEFEEYYSEDDYYQPVVEDFELEYRVKNWCGQNGFDFVSCEGHGDDDGYVPKFRRGRW